MTKLETAEKMLKDAAKAYGKASGEDHDDANTWRELARCALRFGSTWAQVNVQQAGAGLRELGAFLSTYRGKRGER